MLTCLALVLCLGAEPEPVELLIDEFREAQKKATAQVIQEKRDWIKLLKDDGDLPPRRKKRMIAKAEAEISAIENGEVRVAPNMPYPPDLGQIGMLPATVWEIEVIFDEDDMLVRVPVPEGEGSYAHPRFVIHGLSTTHRTEGDKVHGNGRVWAVTGIKSFGENRRVIGVDERGEEEYLIIEPFDMARAADLIGPEGDEP